jgi:hypothetical protein
MLFNPLSHWLLFVLKISEAENRWSVWEDIIRPSQLHRSPNPLTDRNTCNSNPFLHDLQPDNQLHSSACMKLASPDTSEH